MTRSLAVWAVVGLFVVAVVPAAQAQYSSYMANGKHDMNSYGASVTGSEICRPCHTPHNAQSTVGPLWNHTVNAVQSYQLYGPAHSTRFASNYVGLDKTSKLCLSCHDGTIAVDSFGGATGDVKITGAANLGTDLTDDHPVGHRYPGLSTDGTTWTSAQGSGYQDPLAADFGAGGIAGKGVQLVLLPGATAKTGIGCTSCHTPHNNGNSKFLRISNNGSAMCLKCHKK